MINNACGCTWKSGDSPACISRLRHDFPRESPDSLLLEAVVTAVEKFMIFGAMAN